MLFSFTDVEVFSGKMSKLIMKQLSEEFLDKYDYVFWSVTEIPLNKWNFDVKHWYFLIIDNSIDNHLKTQNAGLIGHINFDYNNNKFTKFCKTECNLLSSKLE